MSSNNNNSNNEVIVFPNLPNGLMDEHRKEYVVKGHSPESGPCALEVSLGSSVYRCELNCSPVDISRADHIVFMVERGGQWITATSNSVRSLSNGVFMRQFNGQIETQLSELKHRMEAQECGEWTLLRKDIGTLPKDTNETHLPLECVPIEAKQILLYLNVFTGTNPDSSGYYRIWTQSSIRMYEHHLSLHQYHQNAYSFNSETIWLPVTAERILRVKFEGTTPTFQNGGSVVRVLGWK